MVMVMPSKDDDRVRLEDSREANRRIQADEQRRREAAERQRAREREGRGR